MMLDPIHSETSPTPRSKGASRLGITALACLLGTAPALAQERQTTKQPQTAINATAPKSDFFSWLPALLRSVPTRASTGTSAATRTATIGIRGLGEDGANAAKVKSEELQKLNLYSVSRADAEEFAKHAGLVATHVDYIP